MNLVSSVVLAVIIAALTFGLFWSTKYNEIYTQEYNDKGPCSCASDIISLPIDGSNAWFSPGSMEITYVDENGDTITKKEGVTSPSPSRSTANPESLELECVSIRAASAAWMFILPAVIGAVVLLLVTIVFGLAGSTRREDFDSEKDVAQQ